MGIYKTFPLPKPKFNTPRFFNEVDTIQTAIKSTSCYPEGSVVVCDNHDIYTKCNGGWIQVNKTNI